MFMFFLVFPLVVAAVAPLAASAAGASSQVPIAVYYESLCPDSMKFFTSQLYPIYTSSVMPRINLTLVPYGKSKTQQVDNGQYTFECHHGPNECYGNKVQACAIKKLSTEQSKLMALLNCLMSLDTAKNITLYPITACGEKNKVTDVEEIITCANGTEGSMFLAEMGNATEALMSPLTNVPTIVVNGTFTPENQKKAVANLRELVCGYVEGPEKAKICSSCNPAAAVSLSVFLVLGVLRLL